MHPFRAWPANLVIAEESIVSQDLSTRRIEGDYSSKSADGHPHMRL